MTSYSPPPLKLIIGRFGMCSWSKDIRWPYIPPLPKNGQKMIGKLSLMLVKY